MVPRGFQFPLDALFRRAGSYLDLSCIFLPIQIEGVGVEVGVGGGANIFVVAAVGVGLLVLRKFFLACEAASTACCHSAAS